MSENTSGNGICLEKCPTGIDGLDEITDGGVPRGRTSLITGRAGTGKTLVSLEFLVRGVERYGEPGVFVAFEETADELAQNVASLGWDLNAMAAEGKFAIVEIRITPEEFVETGVYDLEPLLIRLEAAFKSVKAKRIALDTLGALFTRLRDETAVRSGLRRLFRWLKERGITAIVTAEQGEHGLTRSGLEEYVADCVMMLEHRVVEQYSTRYLRIVKYRGSSHGTNNYPFLIGDSGVTVVPITSLALSHEVSQVRVSTGVPRLDAMLGGGGYYRGSSILISGTAGTGKTSFCASFANATCAQGGRVLFCAFEESPAQIMRNMRSIGMDLQQWVDQDRLKFYAARPTSRGLEHHLLHLYRLVEEFQPAAVVLDPTSNLGTVSTDPASDKLFFVRLIDYLKRQQVTTVFTSLKQGSDLFEYTDQHISSLMDTWLLLRVVESNNERNQILYVIKSRGMAHSNQMREYTLTDNGIELRDVYVGTEGVLTGTARMLQEARDRADALARQAEIERKRRLIERKRREVDLQLEKLLAEYDAEKDELETLIAQETRREELLRQSQAELARLRQADLNKEATTAPLTDDTGVG